jgi:hypothetical protein
MNAGWMFLRTEVRRRWRSWLALALIAGAFARAVAAIALVVAVAAAACPASRPYGRRPPRFPFWMMVAGILRSEGWCLAGARCAYHHQRCTCLPSGGPRPRYARTG